MKEETEDRRRESIAAGLRSNRAAKKVSQSKLSDEIGANASTVSAWENSGCISASDAWAVADYYGISLDDLVGRKRPKD